MVKKSRKLRNYYARTKNNIKHKSLYCNHCGRAINKFTYEVFSGICGDCSINGLDNIRHIFK